MEPTIERRALGQVIKTLREMSGMSRGELAQQAGLGIDMIAKVEQGAKSPSTRSRRAIAQALGVDSLSLSRRGTAWANILGTPGETANALKKIATGSAIGSVVAGLGFPVLGPAVGASLAAGALANARDRREAEMALRMMLDQRLAAASDEELEEIASVLTPPPDGTIPVE